MNYEPIVEAWINGNKRDAIRMLGEGMPNSFVFASRCMYMKDNLSMLNYDEAYVFHRFIERMGERDE